MAEEGPIQHEGVNGDFDATGASVARARRKLVLGAAAAVLPSIVTLQSGAQTAVASNVRCWATTPEAGPPDRFSYLPDGWLRKQVYQGKHHSDTAFCAMWDQNMCRDPGNPNKAAAGSIWLVNDHHVTAGPGDQVTGVSSAPQAYALVYVDQYGTVATLDPDPSQHLRPVRESCWTSILGSKASFLG